LHNQRDPFTILVKTLFPTEMQTQFPVANLPELQYGYASLEPILNAEILEVHHKKHHAGYATKYNALTQQFIDAAYKGETSKVQKLCKDVHFNAGGFNVHNLYWENLAPKGNPGGVLPDANSHFSQEMVKCFGSIDNFKAKFNAATGAIQGSGWGWLGYDPLTHQLTVQQTLNQDNVESNGLCPLLTIDVWEHAYYLQYKNLRPDYLNNIWEVVNWRCVENRFNAAV